MATRNALYLHEEILLLALKDEKGSFVLASYEMALGGAILAELLLQKRIGVEESRKQTLVKRLSAKRTGDPVLDEALRKVGDAKRRASLRTWVPRFAGLKRVKHRVAEGLCRRGILRTDEDKVLLIFTRKIYPEVDPGPEREIIARLRRAIFTETKEVDPHTVVLLSLANSTDLLRVIFDRKKLKARKKRIEKIVNGEIIGKATKEAVAAVQAAVMVAVIMPAIMTATMSSRC